MQNKTDGNGTPRAGRAIITLRGADNSGECSCGGCCGADRGGRGASARGDITDISGGQGRHRRGRRSGSAHRGAAFTIAITGGESHAEEWPHNAGRDRAARTDGGAEGGVAGAEIAASGLP